MKILILLSRIDQTGMTTNTLDLVKGLVEQKHEVYLIAGDQIEENKPHLNEIYNNFINIGVKIKQFKVPKGNIISRTILSVVSILKIFYYIITIKPNVIHAQSPYMSFIPWMLRKKFTSTLHVNDFVKSFKYKNASHLIAISQETRDYAIELFGYKKDNITIVNHGVSEEFSISMSPEKKEEFKIANNIPIDKILVGFVGSIEKRKGHDLLLKATAILDPKIREKIHIIFLGSSKDMKTKPWLDNQILKTKTTDIVSCFDYQDPKKFYDIFDIFVLPSRLEGFGLVVVEAMMSECCVIRSNTQGAYDQIHHGKDGFIFENDNYEELSSLLRNVIKNENLRLEIAKKGKETALKRFTIKEMTRGTIKVYKKVQC